MEVENRNECCLKDIQISQLITFLLSMACAGKIRRLATVTLN